jgi:surface polysaccharide O-acyltransferase-like enzyme
MRFGIGVLLIIIDCLIGEFIDPVWPLKFLLYIGYFVLGDAIYRKFQYNKNRYLCYGTFILSFLLSLLGVFVVYGTLTKGEELWGALWKLNRHERLSPIVIVSSIALFVAVANSNIKCKKFFSNISKNSFYIYLIHGGVVSVLGNAWNLIIGKPLGSPWIVVPIYSLIVLGISYLGARLFITIWNRSCIKNGGKNEP